MSAKCTKCNVRTFLFTFISKYVLCWIAACRIWFLKHNQLRSTSLKPVKSGLVVLFYNVVPQTVNIPSRGLNTLRLHRPCFNYINCLPQITGQQSVQVSTKHPPEHQNILDMEIQPTFSNMASRKFLISVIQLLGFSTNRMQQSCCDTYSTTQKFRVGKIFKMFLKEVSSAHQGCIYLIKNTVKMVIL